LWVHPCNVFIPFVSSARDPVGNVLNITCLSYNFIRFGNKYIKFWRNYLFSYCRFWRRWRWEHLWDWKLAVRVYTSLSNAVLV